MHPPRTWALSHASHPNWWTKRIWIHVSYHYSAFFTRKSAKHSQIWQFSSTDISTCRPFQSIRMVLNDCSRLVLAYWYFISNFFWSWQIGPCLHFLTSSSKQKSLNIKQSHFSSPKWSFPQWHAIMKKDLQVQFIL